MNRFRGFVAAAALMAANSILCAAETTTAETCDTPGGIKVQVLGSGGADFANGRAGSAYVVSIDDKARAIVDAGPGSALRFASTGAHTADLDAILLTHVRVDTTLDLPAFVSMALQENRTRTLALYGPAGNRLAPSTVTFVRTLLDGARGAYRHLGDVLSPLAKDSFTLDAHDVHRRPSPVGVRRDETDVLVNVRVSDRIQATAAEVIHGGYPALAWRFRLGDRTIVFTGDSNGEGENLERLARSADLLVAHHSVPEGTIGVERYAHMPPSVIGRIAAQANVKRVVLSHRTHRTLGHEEASLAVIRSRYNGPVTFADDLDCFVVP